MTALGTPGVRARLRGRRILATVIGVPIIVMAVLATGLAASQNSSRNDLQQRFAARGVVTADVLTSYLANLMSHEQRVAAATLAELILSGRSRRKSPRSVSRLRSCWTATVVRWGSSPHHRS